MAALSAVVFALSWWLGLYLLARDPRKPVLVLAAIGLTSFASVVALDAVRVISVPPTLLSSIEIYLVAVPGHRLVRGAARTVPAARHLAQPGRRDRAGRRRCRGRVLRRGDGGQRRRAAAAGPLGDVRGDLAVHARRDGQRGAAGGRSPGRWRASSCVGDAVLRAGQRDPGHPARVWCRAGWRWRPPDSTSLCSASRWRCGMRSTRARRCAPTCCGRSSATRRGGACCSAGRR